jgi:hypothetical protein
MPNGPISTSGLNRNPRNIYIYSSGYDPAPSLTSNYFSILEITSSRVPYEAIFSFERPKSSSFDIKSIQEPRPSRPHDPSIRSNTSLPFLYVNYIPLKR